MNHAELALGDTLHVLLGAGVCLVVLQLLLSVLLSRQISLQLTLFVDGSIKTTQHIPIGVASIREYLIRLSSETDLRQQIAEMTEKEIEAFSNMFLKKDDISVENLIILNDNLSAGISKYFGIRTKNETFDTKKVLVVAEELIDEGSFAESGTNIKTYFVVIEKKVKEEKGETEIYTLF